MHTIRNLIERFNLQPHPEGGYYRETHRSAHQVHSHAHGGPRSAYTSIYFLLTPGTHSAWHRITSDETWFHHAGCDMMILYFDTDDRLQTSTIGPDSGHMQFTVPANTWFAARPVAPQAHSFVSCVVGPGFEFADFELASRAAMHARFGSVPEHVAVIDAFTPAPSDG